MAIADILLDILPGLNHAQEAITHSDFARIADLEKPVYGLVLIGLALFYGLEKLALRSRARRQDTHAKDGTHFDVFLQ